MMIDDDVRNEIWPYDTKICLLFNFQSRIKTRMNKFGIFVCTYVLYTVRMYYTVMVLYSYVLYLLLIQSLVVLLNSTTK